MFHVLGIDAGGTKTVCLLADEGGRVLAASRGGGANLKTAGELAVESDLAPRAVVKRLVTEPAIGAVHLAIAEASGGARVPDYVSPGRVP